MIEGIDMKFIYRVHAIERMFQRNISDSMVEDVIEHGKIIEQYVDDKPYPSCLALGFFDTLPLHVVYAKNDEEYIVITAYIPDSIKWLNDFETRREK